MRDFCTTVQRSVTFIDLPNPDGRERKNYISWLFVLEKKWNYLKYYMKSNLKRLLKAFWCILKGILGNNLQFLSKTHLWANGWKSKAFIRYSEEVFAFFFFNSFSPSVPLLFILFRNNFTKELYYHWSRDMHILACRPNPVHWLCFLRKILLEFSHTHSFMCFLQLLLHYASSTELLW